MNLTEMKQNIDNMTFEELEAYIDIAQDMYQMHDDTELFIKLHLARLRRATLTIQILTRQLAGRNKDCVDYFTYKDGNKE